MQPGLAQDGLARFCLAQGFMPPVILEFPGITCGGALCGGGIESSSHSAGCFADTVLRFDVITGDGRLLVDVSREHHADVFWGMRTSFGTLGVLTRLVLRVEPCAPYVHVQVRPRRGGAGGAWGTRGVRHTKPCALQHVTRPPLPRSTCTPTPRAARWTSCPLLRRTWSRQTSSTASPSRNHPLSRSSGARATRHLRACPCARCARAALTCGLHGDSRTLLRARPPCRRARSSWRATTQHSRRAARRSAAPTRCSRRRSA